MCYWFHGKRAIFSSRWKRHRDSGKPLVICHGDIHIYVIYIYIYINIFIHNVFLFHAKQDIIVSNMSMNISKSCEDKLLNPMNIFIRLYSFISSLYICKSCKIIWFLVLVTIFSIFSRSICAFNCVHHANISRLAKT